MVGDKLKKIITLYESAETGENDKCCVCVHGEHGAGKTALLEKISNSLLMSNVNVYFYIENSDETKSTIENSSDKALRELLRQLLRMYGDLADDNFKNFLASYVKGTLGESSAANRLYDKDSIIKFIYNCIKTEPTVFIIDNLDYADTFTVKLVGNLFKLGLLQFLVISHTDKLENTLLQKILFQNTNAIEYIELKADKKMPVKPMIPAIDEALLVLRKPGREKQLITHHIKSAEQYIKNLAYDRAITSYNDALEVCQTADSNTLPDIFAIQTDLIIANCKTLILAKRYTDAYDLCLPAFRDMINHKSDDSNKVFTEKRIAVTLILAECADKLSLSSAFREYVMLAESYFCIPHHRTQYYDLYTNHILRYLDMLFDTDERIIFREKLKQAYSVCTLDDNEFTCSLMCREAYMHERTGDTAKAFELLTEARSMAAGENLYNLWDEATSCLAAYAEQLDKPELCALLLKELADKSLCPGNIAKAVINLAIMNYEQDGDEQTAVTGIQKGIDLYTLADETQIITEIYEHLKYTPLAANFSLNADGSTGF